MLNWMLDRMLDWKPRVRMKAFIALLVGLIVPSTALAATKVLVVGASITWGCVSVCSPEQAGRGYLERLRALLPTYEFRALTWFSAGLADWDPASPTISEQSLDGPAVLYGVGELHTRERTNLWDLFAGPHIATWRPDYVLFVLGAGDILRVIRHPALPVTTAVEFGEAMDRISSAVLAAGATPVYLFDTPLAEPLAPFVDPIFAGYKSEMLSRCTGHVQCIPEIFDVIDRVEDFADTDSIHFNASGHEAYAEAIADWFIQQNGETTEPPDLPAPPTQP